MTMKVVCINKTGIFVRKRKIDKEKVRLLYSVCDRLVGRCKECKKNEKKKKASQTNKKNAQRDIL